MIHNSCLFCYPCFQTPPSQSPPPPPPPPPPLHRPPFTPHHSEYKDSSPYNIIISNILIPRPQTQWRRDASFVKSYLLLLLDTHTHIHTHTHSVTHTWQKKINRASRYRMCFHIKLQLIDADNRATISVDSEAAFYNMNLFIYYAMAVGSFRASNLASCPAGFRAIHLLLSWPSPPPPPPL